MYPVLFSIGGFSLFAYGTMLAIAFALGIFLMLKDAAKNGLPEDKLLDMSILIIIAALIGSRLLYVLIEWQTFINDPLAIFAVRSGGLSFHGGLLFGIVTGYWYVRRHRMPAGKIADIVAPPLALGYAIVRVGCLLAGCCYGRPSDLPWAMPSSYLDSTLRHPTQLYALIAGLIIFGILLYRKGKTGFKGQLLLEFVIYYSVYRFLVEFFREVSAYIGVLTLGQTASLIAAVGAFVIIRIWPSVRNRL